MPMTPTDFRTLPPHCVDSLAALIPRVCSMCGEEKTLDQFRRDKSKPLGRHSCCRNCQAERDRRYRAEHAEKVRERRRARYWANAEAERERRRAYRIEHTEVERERRRARYWANVERERERNRARYQANAEREREYSRRYRAETRRDDPDYRERNRERARRYYAEHSEQVRERARRYRLEHAEQVREYNRRRRARRRGATVEPVTTADLHTWWDELGLTGCWWCDRPFEPDEPVHIDHLWPLAEEGHHAVRNLVPTHESCNLAKGAALPHEFAARAYADWLDMHADPEEDSRDE